MRVSAQTRKVGLVFVLLLVMFGVGFRLARAQSTDQGQLDFGAQLFVENCVVCHGVDGQGRVGASLAKDWPSIRPDLRIRSTIANGIPGTVMPAWSQANGGPLTEEEIDALVVYISSWETGGPREIPPTPTFAPRPEISPIPDVKGDPNRGAQLFTHECAVCHGQNGEGRIGATLAKNWPSIRADLRVRETIAEGIEGTVMPAWSQTFGGPLSEEEVDDLVAYVLALKPVAGVEAPTATPASAPSGFLTGWGGVFVLLVLFFALVSIAIWVQARRS